MKTFLALYFAPAAAQMEAAKATAAERAEGMKPWFAWKDQHEAHIQDFGAPTQPSLRIDGDRRWTQSGSDLGGYSLVQAETLDAAKAMFQDHPHLAWVPGCRIELAELA